MMNMSQCHIYHCIVANLVVYDRAEVVHNKTVHLSLFSECLGSSRGRGGRGKRGGEKREKGKMEKGKRERGKRKREEGKIEERDREEGGPGMHSSQSHRDQTEVRSFFQGSWNRN